MEREIKKIDSLLNFYNKEGVVISLKLKLKNNLYIKGVIEKKNILGIKYVVIKSIDKAPIKIFLDDILEGSIIPIDHLKKENKNQRSNLPKALRYKIFRRDKFCCQGCGARAPEVEIEVDHKIPVSKGGTDEESNLVTLCRDCNRGKGANV